MRSAILILGLHVLYAFSIVPQDDWLAPPNTPSGKTPTTIVLGQQYTITWDKNLTQWFPTYSPNTSTTNADLWVTGYDLHQYQHLVASSVNVLQTTTVTWKVQLPQVEVDTYGVASWVFRFIQSGLMPNQTKYEISSAEFFVQDLNPPASTTSTTSTTSTSSSSKSTSTSTSTSISTSSTSTSSTSSSPATTTAGSSAQSTSASPTNVPASGGLSTGAKVGIAIGAVFGALALIAAGWFLARRKPSRRHEDNDAVAMTAGGRAQNAYSNTASGREEKQFVEPTQQPVPPYSHQPQQYQYQPQQQYPQYQQQQQPYQELHSSPQEAQRWHELGNDR